MLRIFSVICVILFIDFLYIDTASAQSVKTSINNNAYTELGNRQLRHGRTYFIQIECVKKHNRNGNFVFEDYKKRKKANIRFTSYVQLFGLHGIAAKSVITGNGFEPTITDSNGKALNETTIGDLKYTSSVAPIYGENRKTRVGIGDKTKFDDAAVRICGPTSHFNKKRKILGTAFYFTYDNSKPVFATSAEYATKKPVAAKVLGEILTATSSIAVEVLDAISIKTGSGLSQTAEMTTFADSIQSLQKHFETKYQETRNYPLGIGTVDIIGSGYNFKITILDKDKTAQGIRSNSGTDGHFLTGAVPFSTTWRSLFNDGDVDNLIQSLSTVREPEKFVAACKALETARGTNNLSAIDFVFAVTQIVKDTGIKLEEFLTCLSPDDTKREIACSSRQLAIKSRAPKGLSFAYRLLPENLKMDINGDENNIDDYCKDTGTISTHKLRTDEDIALDIENEQKRQTLEADRLNKFEYVIWHRDRVNYSDKIIRFQKNLQRFTNAFMQNPNNSRMARFKNDASQLFSDNLKVSFDVGYISSLENDLVEKLVKLNKTLDGQQKAPVNTDDVASENIAETIAEIAMAETVLNNIRNGWIGLQGKLSDLDQKEMQIFDWLEIMSSQNFTQYGCMQSYRTEDVTKVGQIPKTEGSLIETMFGSHKFLDNAPIFSETIDENKFEIFEANRLASFIWVAKKKGDFIADDSVLVHSFLDPKTKKIDELRIYDQESAFNPANIIRAMDGEGIENTCTKAL